MLLNRIEFWVLAGPCVGQVVNISGLLQGNGISPEYSAAKFRVIQHPQSAGLFSNRSFLWPLKKQHNALKPAIDLGFMACLAGFGKPKEVSFIHTRDAFWQNRSAALREAGFGFGLTGHLRFYLTFAIGGQLFSTAKRFQPMQRRRNRGNSFHFFRVPSSRYLLSLILSIQHISRILFNFVLSKNWCTLPKRLFYDECSLYDLNVFLLFKFSDWRYEYAPYLLCNLEILRIHSSHYYLNWGFYLWFMSAHARFWGKEIPAMYMILAFSENFKLLSKFEAEANMLSLQHELFIFWRITCLSVFWKILEIIFAEDCIVQ